MPRSPSAPPATRRTLPGRDGSEADDITEMRGTYYAPVRVSAALIISSTLDETDIASISLARHESFVDLRLIGTTIEHRHLERYTNEAALLLILKFI